MGAFEIFDQALDVKIDYSNLEEVVMGLLNQPEELQRRSDAIQPRYDIANVSNGIAHISADILEEYASALRPLLARRQR